MAMHGTLMNDEVFARLNHLPVMPVVIQEVIDSYSKNNQDAAALAGIIAQDQGLSAKVLQVANSSFYGFPRKIGSVQDAVVVLGFNHVRSMVLSAGFVHAFPIGEGSLFDRHAYWKRSFRVACYTHVLAKILKQGQSLAYTAGMFYEIGQLVLDICMPSHFSSLLEQQKTSGVSLVEIEQSSLGCDHALIGSEMARRWNFPAEIEHAIRYWRTPDRKPFEPITAMVYVAVLLESGLGDNALMSRLPGNLCDCLQISWERIAADLPEPDSVDTVANLMLSA